MAAISPDNTARLFVDYVGNELRHSVMFRPQTLVPMADLITWVNGWLSANAGIFEGTTVFDGARVSDINSSVTNPVTWATVTGTGGQMPELEAKPSFGSFVGKSAQGHRTRISFYGMTYPIDPKYRLPALAGNGLLAAVSGLNNLQAKLGDITGSKAVWKQYLNQGYNGYWQREQRKGA